MTTLAKEMHVDHEGPSWVRALRRYAAPILLSLALTLGYVVFAKSARAETARVALQFGIGYLPLSVMQARSLWERHARLAGIDLTVEWQNLGNGSALNDAILTGSADIAAGGIAPMLKLWDRTRGNLKVRGIAALVTTPTLLLTNRPEIKTLADFKPTDRIAVSIPKVSLQAVLLQMAAAKLWGPGAYAQLDEQTVAMKHPDAVVALLSPRSPIAGYFASSPYQEQVLQHPGIHVVASSDDVIGSPSTFSAAWTTAAFVQKQPKLYAAFLAGLEEAMAAIAEDKARAVDDFIRVSNTNPVERALLLAIVERPDTVYSTAPRSTIRYAEFLARIGSISAAPSSWKDYFFEDAQAKDGS